MKVDRSKAPETRGFDSLKIPAEEVEVLENGVTLHVIADTSLPATRVTTMWNYGFDMSNAFGQGSSAAANFATQMMREGTKKLTGTEIADKVEFSGAMLAPRTHDHYSSLDLTGLSESIPELLDIIRDAYCGSIFPQAPFEALKRQAVTTREIELSKVGVRAGDAIFTLMAGKKHPYVKTDRPEDIEGCGVGQAMQAYADGTRHTELHVFAGGFVDADMKARIKDYALGLRETRLTNPLKLDIVPFQPEPAQEIHIPQPTALQTAVAIGLPTIGRDHPDYIRLRCAVIALGGYFGSRLMTNIREEKGLTYSISAGLNGLREGAFMSVKAHCPNDKAGKVIEEIRKETELLGASPMGDEELMRLKRFLISTLATILDSPFSIAGHYQNRYLVGTPENYFRQQFEQINSLNANDIMAMASKYLKPGQFRIATCGKEERQALF